MTHQDYLPFHSQLLWECAKELNYVFVKELGSSNDQIQLMSPQALARENRSFFVIKNQTILLKFLSKGGKTFFSLRENFCLLYAQKLFSSQQQEHIDYFIKHTSLLRSYDCGDFAQLLPFLDEPTLDKIFSLPYSQFPLLGEFANFFENLILQLQDYPKHIQWINQFLQPKGIHSSQLGYKIRDKLISVFPNQLEQFRSFQPIDEYLTAQENQPSPFVDHAYENIITISLNQSILQQLYSIPEFGLEDYQNSLEYMCEGLSKSTQLGVSHHQFTYQYNSSTKLAFLQFDITLYLTKNSIITKPLMQEFIGEFYSDYLKNLWTSYSGQLLHESQQMNDIIDMTPQFFFHFMMKKSLPDNSDKLSLPKI